MSLKKSSRMSGCRKVPSEKFSLWLEQSVHSLKTGEAVNVPCGGCSACCTSSYFIHIKPRETETISKIPGDMMFPAPGLPKGNLLLGYDENGRCPMFIENRCSIYDYRPQTCRTYDCRIFPATGLMPEEVRENIRRQARQWEFDFSGIDDLINYEALRSAAKFINKHTGCFPPGFIPGNTLQQAMLALLVYEIFLNLPGVDEKTDGRDFNHATAEKIINAYKRFEHGE